MKKTITVILAFAVLFVFTSCLSGGTDSAAEEDRGTPTVSINGSGSGIDEPIGGEAACTGLTDADMKAIIANYDDIMTALDEYGADCTEDDYNTVNEDIEKILDKYGISGPGRYNKMIMAHYCEVLLAYNEEMSKDPSTAMIMKAMGLDPVAEYRSMVNDDDYEVVKANHKAFKKVVENY